jgi:hypothetical protein
MLKLFHTAPRLVSHRSEYCNKLICFLMQLPNGRAVDAAIFTQKFNPQLRFVRFLQRSVDL